MQYPPFDNGNAIFRNEMPLPNGLHRIIVDFVLLVCLFNCNSKLLYVGIQDSHLLLVGFLVFV